MSHKYFGPYEQYRKRPLDCMLATGMFVVLSPVLGVTAVLVKTKLGSPVLFTQERPGKDEKVFKLYKFRTMTDDRGPDGELLPDEDRLTPFGKMLRSTSLDELPELINVCDRILVISNGKSTGILEKEQFDQEAIMKLATKEFSAQDRKES